MSRVELELESPLMVGGKRLTGNVLESLEYIPGSVVRAAFARQILLNCYLYKQNECDPQGRYNYVYVRDEEKCKQCHLFNVCKEFSNTKFSFFYQKGCDVIPFTSKGCKTFNDHGFKDVFAGDKELVCQECKNDMYDGRMDSASGFRNGRKIHSSEKVVFTRTALDTYTQTALDGSLHSINALKPGIVFEGEIDKIENLFVKEQDKICIGRYTSTGFGQMKVLSVAEKRQERNLLELLYKFNEKRRSLNTQDDKFYIPLLFKSDAKLGIEELNLDTPLSNNEYKKIWEKLILGENSYGLKIEQVYSEHEIYRGFDTSRESGKWDKEPQVMVLKGTSVLMSTMDKLENIMEVLVRLENNGIGSETLNGYGEIEICNEIHVGGGI